MGTKQNMSKGNGKKKLDGTITGGSDNKIKTIGETEMSLIRVFIDAFKGQIN